jgi:hypothetical protein
MPDFSALFDKHANRVGIDPKWLRNIAKVESGGDPKNVTGSYQGLFQLSKSEFNKHGGSGNILDPEQNTMAAANKLAKEKLAFSQKYGRDPSLTDLYMIHQQGEGGAAAHLANPDQPAWKSMLSTGEGKSKGEAWAKKAIWGNVPDDLKAKYGSVDNITSKDFYAMWGQKVEGSGFQGYGPLKVAKKEGDEGWQGTKRGTFLGEGKEEPEKKAPDRKPWENVDLDVGEIVPRISVGRMKVPG